METTWLILLAVALFLIIITLYWKLTKAYFKKEQGAKMWMQWGTKTYYWQGAIFVSTGATLLILYLLKLSNLLTF